MDHKFDGFVPRIPAAEEPPRTFDDMTNEMGYDPLDNSNLFARLVTDPWSSISEFPAVYLKTADTEVEIHKVGKDPVVIQIARGARPGFKAVS